MAHRLTSKQESGSAGSSHNDQAIAGKSHLNRRDYVRLGAAAVGLSAIGGSIAASSDAGSTFVTDFQEYAQ